MKRFILYTAIVFALSLAASCNIIEDTDSGRGLIRFAPKTLDTKAMVDNDNVAGETFTVVDLLTTGTGNSTSTSTHINTNIKYNNGKWEYDPAATYYWNTGTHKFFGYTAGIGQMSNAWKLTIPATGTKTITTADASQTDMLYSSIFSTTADAWTGDSEHDANTPVTLKFHHLLSAISVTVENYTGAAVTVNSVTVTLPNKASATVDFSVTTEKPTVTYSETVATEGVFHSFSPQTPLSLADGGILDVLTGSVLTSDTPDATPYVIWPQKLAKNAASFTVSMTINNETVNRTAYVPENTEWKAGIVNVYNIRIYPETLDITFNVAPWEHVPLNIVSATGSINMSNVTWMNTKVRMTATGEDVNTVVNSAYSVTMYYKPYVQNPTTNAWEQYSTYYPAQGFFTVNYPSSGKFKLGLIPAYGESTVDASKYAIFIYDNTFTGATKPWRPYITDGEDITNDTVYFQIRPASEQNSQQYKAQLDIWFCTNPTAENPEWVSAYSEVRANYALIIPAN